jgi:carbonic anhydrase
MSIIDKALEANRNYAGNYSPTLGKPPTPKIAVVTCMDPRLSDLPEILGLPRADIDVIRTGGPAVTDDVLGKSSSFPTVSSERRRSCSSITRAADSRHSLTMR